MRSVSIWVEVEHNDNRRTHQPLRHTSRNSFPGEKCVREEQRKEHIMFETATLSYGPPAKRVWATAMGFTGQALLIGCALLAPLISPQQLGRAFLVTTLVTPGAPPPPAPPGPRIVPGSHVRSPHNSVSMSFSRRSTFQRYQQYSLIRRKQRGRAVQARQAAFRVALGPACPTAS